MDGLSPSLDLILPMEKTAFVRLEKREEMAPLPGQLQDLADDLLEAPRWRCLSRKCGDENPLQVVENVEDRVEGVVGLGEIR